MKLYLMRHGETDGNKARILQGRKDMPLNENGRDQAELAREDLKGILFDAYYVSPLSRAIQTAELVTGKTRDAFVIEDRIVEISFGNQEGKTLEELGPEFQKFFLEPQNYVPIQGAESFESLIARVADFLEDMKTRDQENILVVSHGAAIHAMLLVVEHLSMEEFWSIDVGNCGITEMTLIDGEWKITKACETQDAFYGKGKLQA